ncbi:MAG: hypothetical protein IPL12_19380 [Bacteroidetes bacterium]|nr:hypothetical protein [Bacteroidota bacterium]
MHEQVKLLKTIGLINGYDGSIALQQYLKNWFRENKNAGSRDRKIYTALLYNYFRIKGAATEYDQQALVVQAAALDEVTHGLYEVWKTELPDATFAIKQQIPFPLENKISASVDKAALFTALKSQPAVFIRVKQAMLEEVKKECTNKDYFFTVEGNTLRFAKNYPLTEMKTFANGDFEIQDIASQQTIQLIQPQKNEAWWDCCAGSGGKSLMLMAQQPQIQLFVSDIRKSILDNLKERFTRNGILNYNGLIVDLTISDTYKRLPLFDGIIADVPCSGSGTWTRTPEWLSFFDEQLLQEHITRQREIITGICNQLKPGGKLIYLTCSVYQDENELNVEYFTQHLPLTLVKQQYFQYSAEGGDTLFGAELVRK